MTREELKEYLPHREHMLLVDEIDIDDGGICHASYKVKEDEFFCQGHFPDNPIVPGVILCEIMAQSCALLVKDEIKDDQIIIKFTCALLNCADGILSKIAG